MSKLSENTIKDRIKNLAKVTGLKTTDIYKKLFLERFLARLSVSSYADKFVFKGGNLLSYYLPIFRETFDLDFITTELFTAKSVIAQIFTEIGQIKLDDGFVIDLIDIAPLCHPAMLHAGFRVTMTIKFKEGHLKDNIQIDVAVGDQMVSPTKVFSLIAYNDHPLFEEYVSLRAYPPERIFAEKLEAAFSKVSENSRMKDYNDLILMCRHKTLLNHQQLRNFILLTFKERQTKLILPIKPKTDGRPIIEQYWQAFRLKLMKFSGQDYLPPKFSQVLHELNEFLIKLNFPLDKINQ